MTYSPPATAASSRLLTVLVPALMGAALPLGLLVGPVRMRGMVTEDHLVEWLQFGLLLGAALLLFRRWAVLRAFPGRLFDARFYGLVGAVALFVALEEISWGQRLLGFETPHGVEDANRQGEFNLHNVVGFHDLRNWLPLAFSVCATLVIAGATRVPGGAQAGRIRRLLPERGLLFSLLVCLAVSAWMLVLYLTRLLPHDDWRVGRVVAEWSELMVAYVVFLYAWGKSRASLPSAGTEAGRG